MTSVIDGAAFAREVSDEPRSRVDALRARGVTPGPVAVHGGIGPMTIAMLLVNTVTAVERQSV